MAIKILDENCPWCNKKTVGQDESGFKACVSCDYDSDTGKGLYKLSNEERHNRGHKIYEELNCDSKNRDHGFSMLCDKLKGHKGKHIDNTWKEFPW